MSVVPRDTLLILLLILALVSSLLAGCGEEVHRSPRVSDGRLLTIADAYPPPTSSDARQADASVVPPPPPRPRPDSGAAPTRDAGGGARGLSPMEIDLLKAINNARTKKGLNALVADPRLMCAARLAAKVVPPSGSCGHVGNDGSWPHHRAKTCGMSNAASWKVNEIAAGPGFRDGADAVWGWSQSAGHWWGLTHPQAKAIGVAATSKGCFWALFDCCIKGS